MYFIKVFSLCVALCENVEFFFLFKFFSSVFLSSCLLFFFSKHLILQKKRHEKREKFLFSLLSFSQKSLSLLLSLPSFLFDEREKEVCAFFFGFRFAEVRTQRERKRN